jgi:hypothetical protein
MYSCGSTLMIQNHVQTNLFYGFLKCSSEQQGWQIFLVHYLHETKMKRSIPN